MQAVVRRKECVVYSAIVQFGEDVQFRQRKGEQFARLPGVWIIVCEKNYFARKRDIADSETSCHCPRGSASEQEPVPRTAADARFGDCKQGDEGQGRQKGFAAAGQHGSSTNRPGPGQVLWPRTRL